MKRNESMAHTLHGKLKEPTADENKRGPRPQDLIRLYDIILQVIMRPSEMDTIIHIMTDTPDLLICVFSESGWTLNPAGSWGWSRFPEGGVPQNFGLQGL